MKITSLPYRTAVYNALDDKVVYNNVKIHSFVEYLQETSTRKKAILSGDVQAYIILLNQTSNESQSNKCNYNTNDTIQIQITTVWPAGKGGYQVAEGIANAVLALLFPTDLKNTDLSITGMDIWKSEVLSTRNINYNDSSSRTWITQIVLESSISQS